MIQIAFDQTELVIGVAKFSAIIGYNTTIVVMDDGSEARNGNWDTARLKFDVSGAVQSTTDLGTLITFIRARHGPLRGFVIKDWSDYKMTNEAQVASHPGGAGTFQLVKTYDDGFNADVRDITKVKISSLQLKSGATTLTPTTHYTISSSNGISTTGIVTLTAACPAGTITAGCEFYVPVRFELDENEINLLFYRLTEGKGQLPQVRCVEIRDIT